jgi:Leucine-rich repeat (LRR) protein
MDRLRMLRQLNASDNELGGLPSGIAALPQLCSLDVSNNDIVALPALLGEHTNTTICSFVS